MRNSDNVSMSNIYRLDGRVPIGRAVPFGLQHVLAMFVANLTPITIIGAAAGLESGQIAVLLQNAMFVAGIATLIQLYPVWKIGSRLPIVMGVSFTFVTILSYVGSTYGYETMVGAVLVGGLVEGTLGLLAKYWRKIITPVVAASVVTAIGYSLFTVGARSFGGGYTEEFGSAKNLILGTITLVTCILFNILAKGYWKQLSVLAGLVVGYIVAIFMGMVDFSGIMSGGIISLPHFLPFKPEFNVGAIVSVVIIFLVSAAETIGDTTAMVSGGLNREITTKEISGSLACDGYASTVSSLFGCPPVTSFSQNVGLINMTKVVNEPFYNYDRSCMHDSCRTSSSNRKLFCKSSGRCFRWMYHHDVRYNSCERYSDGCKSWIFSEKYYNRSTFSGCRNRLYKCERDGYMENFSTGGKRCIFS